MRACLIVLTLRCERMRASKGALQVTADEKEREGNALCRNPVSKLQ
jgi:hypothetical protein